MKKQIFPIILLLVFLSATNSCKDGLFDITEEFYLTTTIDVVGSNIKFSGEELLDAVAGSDMIDKYASHIKSIEVLEVKYYVSYFNGTLTQQIDAGTLAVADQYGNGVYDIASVYNVNLSQSGEETILPFSQSAVDRLADLIKNDPHKAMIYLKGDVNETPVDFQVTIKFKVKMVAETI